MTAGPITKEVFFAICPHGDCGKRIEIDPDHLGNAVSTLYAQFAEHQKYEHGDSQAVGLQEFKRLVRTENVVQKDLDLSEIISKRQLRRRARRLAKTLKFDEDTDREDRIKEAEKLVRETILKDLQSGILHTCSCCGKPISKEHAEKSGMGPKCTSGTHKCGTGEEDED